MARNSHGLLKVLTGIAMPNPSTPCGPATPTFKAKFTSISRVARLQSGCLVAMFYTLEHPMSYASDNRSLLVSCFDFTVSFSLIKESKWQEL
jgi:hypothetical protein